MVKAAFKLRSLRELVPRALTHCAAQWPFCVGESEPVNLMITACCRDYRRIDYGMMKMLSALGDSSLTELTVVMNTFDGPLLRVSVMCEL